MKILFFRCGRQVGWELLRGLAVLDFDPARILMQEAL